MAFLLFKLSFLLIFFLWKSSALMERLKKQDERIADFR